MRPLRRTNPAWTQEAWARLAELETRLHFVDSEQIDSISAKLHRAESILTTPIPPWYARLANWWNGDLIEQTWAWLQAAELQIVEWSDRAGILIATNLASQRASSALGEKDPSRIAIDQLANELTLRRSEPTRRSQ